MVKEKEEKKQVGTTCPFSNRRCMENACRLWISEKETCSLRGE